MTSDEQVHKLLQSHGIDLVGSLVRDGSDSRRIYAFIRLKMDSDNKKEKTNYELTKIANSLINDGVHVSFIITDGEESDVEETIKSSLFRFFSDLVRNVFVSFSNKKASVWIEPKRLLSQEDEENMNEKCAELLHVLEVQLESVRFTSSENVPTRTACLKAIRLHAPIPKENLSKALTERGFHVPSDEWLSRMLDSLRKSGLVLRRKDGGFVLTHSALINLGSAKNSRSPDISRALALARRG